jgi:hypothetical protein
MPERRTALSHESRRQLRYRRCRAKLRQQHLKTMIIAPAERYTVDCQYRKGANFDQPKWARSRSSFQAPLTAEVPSSAARSAARATES